MRKADNVLSRRKMIRGAATALVAGATINVAAIAATKATPSDVDAELIRLGNELAALWPEHTLRLEALNDIGDRAWELAEQRTGIKHPGRDEIRNMKPGEFNRLLAAMCAAQEELKMQHQESRFLEISNRADGLMKRIDSLQASTAAGLGAKAITVAFLNSELWDESAADQDIEKRQVRLLVDAAFAASGIANPVTQGSRQS
jgi:hypothetical protein